MKTIYFVSGLGADERVFQFLDLNVEDQRHIKWIAPNPKESLVNYVKRLSEQIDQPKDSVLIGVSFGGIVAIELSKILTFSKVIIISSIKNKKEFTFYFKIAGKLGLDYLIPGKLMKRPNRFANYLFGIELSKRKLLDCIGISNFICVNMLIKQVVPAFGV